LIAALLRSSGSEGDLHVWHNGNQTTMMNLETGSAVVINNLPSNGNGSEEITSHIITRKIPTLVGVEQVFLHIETRIGGEDVQINVLVRKKPTW
jgi:hypothetical protein